MNQLTDNGLALIKSFEGLRLKAYKDVGGVYTIGYGHTEGVKENQECSIEQAEDWLSGDIANKAELPILSFLGSKKLTDEQYSALVSLVYNCGPAPLHGTLGTYILAGNYPEAAKQFLRWDHVHGKVIPGLTRRRKAEMRMFNDDIR